MGHAFGGNLELPASVITKQDQKTHFLPKPAFLIILVSCFFFPPLAPYPLQLQVQSNPHLPLKKRFYFLRKWHDQEYPLIVAHRHQHTAIEVLARSIADCLLLEIDSVHCAHEYGHQKGPVGLYSTTHCVRWSRTSPTAASEKETWAGTPCMSYSSTTLRSQRAPLDRSVGRNRDMHTAGVEVRPLKPELPQYIW
jgi:hypothetical protein